MLIEHQACAIRSGIDYFAGKIININAVYTEIPSFRRRIGFDGHIFCAIQLALQAPISAELKGCGLI